MKFFSAILLALLFAPSAWLQELVDVKNIDGYQNPRNYSTKDGRLHNDPEFYSHPDFGKLTFQAPYEIEVIEDISKRTEYERYYIDKFHPAYFYIEKSSKKINLEVNGQFIAIDPSMHRVNDDVFSSGFQSYKTGIDAINQRTSMSFGEHFVNFNHTKLKLVHLDLIEEIIEPDWSDFEMNNFEAYVFNIFPNIDMQIQFFEGRVKSNFIIKQNMNVKELIFIDELFVSDGLDFLLSSQNPFGLNYLEIYNTESSQTEIVVEPARSFDASGSNESWLSEFQLDDNKLLVIADSAHLNDPNNVYPITIDPTFIAVGPITNGGGVMGSLLSPSSCANNINLVFPGGSEPWDTQVTWTLFSDFCAQFLIDFGVFIDCWNSEAEIWVTSGCGGNSPVGSPGTIWACTLPACNTFGFWVPTIPFASSGTQSLVQCYPTQCVNQNMQFTINLDRTFCNSAYGNDGCNWATSYCQSLDDWSVTVQGRSVETLSNTVTGNGTQNIFDADCAGTQTLDPTPLYGVPGYTYAWSTGATTPTIVVPGTVSTFTADVTDACGTTVTATFDIGCPLATEMNDFEAELKNGIVELEWSTISETDLTNFEIEKSNNGIDWRSFGIIDATGGENISSEYQASDQSPQVGLNYYRLKLNNEDGTSTLSDVKVIQIEHLFSFKPNPANDLVQVQRSTEKNSTYAIEVTDFFGKIVFEKLFEESNETIDLSDIESGTYIMSVTRNGVKIESQRLIIAH
ncbi:MAG: hypothetical protein BM555_05530 [Crocinitomix sp. MedPE-SWsnd]|nr:MAG: hypothetical protein BM555_05530 [Crocinitomix sp. MedPE-SWsnd]